MISRPIITPAKHSKSFIKTLYHNVFVISKVTTSARNGPKTIPAISQPRIAGSFSFEINLPHIKATQIIAKMRRSYNHNNCTNLSMTASGSSRALQSFSNEPSTMIRIVFMFSSEVLSSKDVEIIFHRASFCSVV